MTYTALSAAAAVTVVLLDLLVLRTRLLLTARWWLSWAIILVFQLLVNGWLTGRQIVRYDSDAILGGGAVRAFGDGRVGYAPVEDLGFGFALVLLTCAVWSWLDARRTGTRVGRPPRRDDAGAR